MKKTKLYADTRTDAQKHQAWLKTSGYPKSRRRPVPVKGSKKAKAKVDLKEAMDGMMRGAMMGIMSYFFSRALSSGKLNIGSFEPPPGGKRTPNPLAKTMLKRPKK
jgi:hypothetical protein